MFNKCLFNWLTCWVSLNPINWNNSSNIYASVVDQSKELVNSKRFWKLWEKVIWICTCGVQLMFQRLSRGFIYLQKTSVLVPPNYTEEIFAVIDLTTPACPVHGQSCCFSNSPSFPSFTLYIWHFRWDKSWLWGPELCIIYGQWEIL